MNHRKIRSHSQVYVPFSWEDKPGIPKSMIKSSSDMDDLSSENLAPPPPCTQRKSGSSSCRWRDDPFLAALKSCSKGDHHAFKEKMMKLMSKSGFFSCKHSSDVENDNLVKFSKLPPIPKERYYTKSIVRN